MKLKVSFFKTPRLYFTTVFEKYPKIEENGHARENKRIYSRAPMKVPHLLSQLKLGLYV